MPEGFFDAGTIASNGRIADWFRNNNPAVANKITRLWIPNLITTIGNNAFKGCENLAEIVFEDGGTQPLSIGLMSFAGCTSLSGIALPSRTISIGRGCFRDCTALRLIEIGEGDSLLSVSEHVFDNCAGGDEMAAAVASEVERRQAFMLTQGARETVGNARTRQQLRVMPMQEGELEVHPEVSSQVSVPSSVPSGTLFVCVDETYGAGKKDPMTGEAISLEDCAKGYWTEGNLKGAHADRCSWLMARVKGRICGVWKIDRKFGWKDASEVPKRTWPSDRREGACACRFLPDDEEVVQVRAACLDGEVHLGWNHNSLRSIFYS